MNETTIITLMVFACVIAYFIVGVVLYVGMTTAIDRDPMPEGAPPIGEVRRRILVLSAVWPGTVLAFVLALVSPKIRNWLLHGRRG